LADRHKAGPLGEQCDECTGNIGAFGFHGGVGALLDPWRRRSDRLSYRMTIGVTAAVVKFERWVGAKLTKRQVRLVKPDQQNNDDC
jgi:hypothetical protein